MTTLFFYLYIFYLNICTFTLLLKLHFCKRLFSHMENNLKGFCSVVRFEVLIDTCNMTVQHGAALGLRHIVHQSHSFWTEGALESCRFGNNAAECFTWNREDKLSVSRVCGVTDDARCSAPVVIKYLYVIKYFYFSLHTLTQ